ncbi:MAG: NUMOD4 motif-containing HNH endonuclease [Chryseobacterium sp.]|nr:NUMOD4 motif-containing HNH endonuclease [Chryseobacterium sp.]
MKQVNMREIMSVQIDDLPDEVWREIPEYKGNYFISNFGRVKSFTRKRSVILRKTLSSGKYFVKISARRGRFKCENVGRIVATVFIRPPFENEVIRYKDGNRLNDQAYNLEWISRKESVNVALGRDRYSQKGVRNGMAVLNEYDAKEIRELKASGNTYQQISRKYNVSITCIQNIIQNKCWKIA